MAHVLHIEDVTNVVIDETQQPGGTTIDIDIDGSHVIRIWLRQFLQAKNAVSVQCQTIETQSI